MGSGFQDLLANTLVVWAVVAHATGRNKAAALLCGLAPLAKETGFLAVPLIWGYGILVERRKPIGSWILLCLLAILATTAIHLGVRTTWPEHPKPEAVRTTTAAIAVAMKDAVLGFAPMSLPHKMVGWLAGVVAGVLAVILISHIRPPQSGRERPPGRPWVFVAVALAVSVTPFMAIVTLGSAVPRPHFLAPAIPWICLLLGGTLGLRPKLFWECLLIGLTTANVWSLSYRALDMDSTEGWEVGFLGWDEAVRMEARTRRLSEGLRTIFAARPESLVVLYETIPAGSLIQTGNGPATREIPENRTVRAYLLKEAPESLASDRIAIVTYNQRLHRGFTMVDRDCYITLAKAVDALLRERPRIARAWVTYCLGTGEYTLFAHYLLAAADLLSGGVESYVAELDRAGLLDTLSIGALRSAWRIGPDLRLDAAYSSILASPRSTTAHAAAADTLLNLDAPLLAALELRIAVALGSASATEALLLGRILAGSSLPYAARRAFRSAIKIGKPLSDVTLARSELEKLDR